MLLEALGLFETCSGAPLVYHQRLPYLLSAVPLCACAELWGCQRLWLGLQCEHHSSYQHDTGEKSVFWNSHADESLETGLTSFHCKTQPVCDTITLGSRELGFTAEFSSAKGIVSKKNFPRNAVDKLYCLIGAVSPRRPTPHLQVVIAQKPYATFQFALFQN